MDDQDSCVSDDLPTPLPRLLLVENEPSLCVLLNDLLHAEYQVQTVPDAEGAWQSARRQIPDLVLADIRLNHSILDGIELTRRWRAQAETAGLLIVLLTSCNDPEAVLQGFEAGADDFVLKPFRPRELLARLRSHRRLIELRRKIAARNLSRELDRR